jgi:hypothetical protein
LGAPRVHAGVAPSFSLSRGAGIPVSSRLVWAGRWMQIVFAVISEEITKCT